MSAGSVQAQPEPTPEEVVGNTLRVEVDRFIASFDQCHDVDVLRYLSGPLGGTPDGALYRRWFDQADSHVELVYVSRGVQGHFPAYGLWLRANTSAGDAIAPSQMDSGIRRFASVAATADPPMVSSPVSLDLEPTVAQELGEAVCDNLDAAPTFQSISDLLDDAAGGNRDEFSVEQWTCLQALANDPAIGIRDYEAMVYRQLSGFDSETRQRRLHRLDQNFVDGPTDAPTIPFFQQVLHQEGAL